MRTISYTGLTFRCPDAALHWYDTDPEWQLRNLCLLIPDQVINNTLTSVFMARLLTVESNMLLMEY